ncbi:MAG: hypothetical protein ABEJ08_00565 [Halobacteriaceae archaeon]
MTRGPERSPDSWIERLRAAVPATDTPQSATDAWLFGATLTLPGVGLVVVSAALGRPSAAGLALPLALVPPAFGLGFALRTGDRLGAAASAGAAGTLGGLLAGVEALRAALAAGMPGTVLTAWLAVLAVVFGFAASDLD